MSGYSPEQLGPRTVRALLLNSLTMELQEELRLRFGPKWGSKDISFEAAIRQIKDILHISHLTVIR